MLPTCSAGKMCMQVGGLPSVMVKAQQCWPAYQQRTAPGMPNMMHVFSRVLQGSSMRCMGVGSWRHSHAVLARACCCCCCSSPCPPALTGMGGKASHCIVELPRGCTVVPPCCTSGAPRCPASLFGAVPCNAQHRCLQRHLVQHRIVIKMQNRSPLCLYHAERQQRMQRAMLFCLRVKFSSKTLAR